MHVYIIVLLLVLHYFFYILSHNKYDWSLWPSNRVTNLRLLHPCWFFGKHVNLSSMSCLLPIFHIICIVYRIYRRIYMYYIATLKDATHFNVHMFCTKPQSITITMVTYITLISFWLRSDMCLISWVSLYLTDYLQFNHSHRHRYRIVKQKNFRIGNLYDCSL